MDIANLLSILAYRKINELAAQWGVKSGSLKQTDQTAKLLVIAYRDPGMMKKMLDQLNPDQFICLQMIINLSITYPHGMNLKDAIRKVNELPNTKGMGEKIVQLLLSKGLLFLDRSQWYEIIVAPDEVFFAVTAPLADQLVSRYRERISSFDQAAEVKVVENHSLSIYHDLITMMSFLAHENVEITQKGHIYKRTMNRLIEKFRSHEERFPNMINEDLPKHFLFMEQFLVQNSLIKFNTYAKLQSTALQTFLAVPYSEWITPLLTFYYRNIYVAQHRQPTPLFNSVLMRLGHDEWVYEDALLDTLAKHATTWKTTVREIDMSLQIYNPYFILGLMQRGQDHTGRYVWKWTSWGLEYIRHIRPNAGLANHLESLLTDQIYVQPNLEIIVPENVIPAVRWMVEAFAELKQADSVFIYEMNKAKILHALECGWTYPQIRDHLIRLSLVPVTANVIKTLEGWCGNFGKAILWDVMVIQIQDPTVAAMIAKDRKLASYQITVFSDQAFAIRRSDEAAVRKLMDSLGCPVPLLVRGKDHDSTKAGKGNYGSPHKKTAADLTSLHHLEVFEPDTIKSALQRDKVIHTILEPINDMDDYDDVDEDEDDFFDPDDMDEDEFDFESAIDTLFKFKKR